MDQIRNGESKMPISNEECDPTSKIIFRSFLNVCICTCSQNTVWRFHEFSRFFIFMLVVWSYFKSWHESKQSKLCRWKITLPIGSLVTVKQEITNGKKIWQKAFFAGIAFLSLSHTHTRTHTHALLKRASPILSQKPHAEWLYLNVEACLVVRVMSLSLSRFISRLFTHTHTRSLLPSLTFTHTHTQTQTTT